VIETREEQRVIARLIVEVRADTLDIVRDTRTT